MRCMIVKLQMVVDNRMIGMIELQQAQQPLRSLVCTLLDVVGFDWSEEGWICGFAVAEEGLREGDGEGGEHDVVR